MQHTYRQAGYREGITAGKESALQKGFDDGFARIGAPLGREIGMLRGAANAAIWLISKWASSPGADPAVYMPREREVHTILCELADIGLEDLAPRDVQAEEHAEEHRRGEIGTTLGEVQISAEANAHADGVNSLGSVQEQIALVTDEPLVVKPAVEKLNQLRIRLSKVLRELGLDITLG